MCSYRVARLMASYKALDVRSTRPPQTCISSTPLPCSEENERMLRDGDEGAEPSAECRIPGRSLRCRCARGLRHRFMFARSGVIPEHWPRRRIAFNELRSQPFLVKDIVVNARVPLSYRFPMVAGVVGECLDES